MSEAYLASGNACKTVDSFFQEFVIGENDYALTNVTLILKRIGTGEGNVILTIRKSVCGEALTCGQVAASTISTEYSLIRFNLAEITLEANTWYFLTVEYPNISTVLEWQTEDSLQFVFEFSDDPSGNVSLSSKQDNNSTTNLGLIQIDYVNYALPCNVNVPINILWDLDFVDPSPTLQFDHWEVSDNINIENPNSKYTHFTITDSNPATIKAIYQFRED